jgi:hypothetical protein
MVQKLVHFFARDRKTAHRSLLAALALGLATAGLVACAETADESPTPDVSSEVEGAIDDAAQGSELACSYTYYCNGGGVACKRNNCSGVATCQHCTGNTSCSGGQCRPN